MHAIAPSAWRLLSATLRESGYRAVSLAELRNHGLDADAFLASGLLSRAGSQAWTPPGCEHNCVANTDFESRAPDNIVGVACPYEEACWSGWKWVSADLTQLFDLNVAGLAGLLREANGLERLATSVPMGVVAVGQLTARGLTAAVLLMTQGPTLEQLCHGLRAQIGVKHLIAIVTGNHPVRLAAEGLAILDVPVSDTGDLQLTRALDLFAPGYQTAAASDPHAVFDDVRIEFAEEPGRHVVRINGEVMAGFAKSDLRFLRMLLLAAHRKSGNSNEDGWIEKHQLEGDEKDRDLAGLRQALGPWARVLKTQRHGPIRLAVARHSISFDATLSTFAVLMMKPGPVTGRATAGRHLRQAGLEKGNKTATNLLKKISKLGVPTGDSSRTGEKGRSTPGR